MGKKAVQFVLALSIVLAAALMFGLVSYAFSRPPAHAEKGGINTRFTEEVLPWGIDRVDAGVVHSHSKGCGVRVAILDTGIDLCHADLRVAGDVTFVPGTTNGDDDNGHGTMVAGIIAALDNDFGVVGIAPGVELYSVKVLNKDGTGEIGAVLNGIEWAIAHNMQVINISFGSRMNMPRSVREALERAYNDGIVIVACAGNEGTASGEGDTIWAPAKYQPVIAVGAIDERNKRDMSSGTGDTLELVAPGINICSTAIGGGYGSISYTSASSPHVAGVAALLCASGVNSCAEVREILQQTAEDLGPPGWDSWYGYGLVNANKALAVALPTIVP